MISLSRIIKLSHYQTSDESFLLSVKSTHIQTVESDERLQENLQIVKNAEEEAGIILQDAEETAQGQLREAMEQAEKIRQDALAEIEQWWENKRQEAAALFSETEAQAREQGFQAGLQDGKQLAWEEEREKVEEARNLLEFAHREKERIISEAEPFLVELSLEIAKKIIGNELSASPEAVLEIVKNTLQRSRVHGEITVCVNQRHFDFVQQHRPQLLALLDGQAEIAIYPDHTVDEGGCVIRTPLGSVDARIDTQLTEIRQALLDIAKGSDEA
ncbi:MULTISPECIES: flagellar assembly protein FliH [Brevibacillus]|jgi:flagellar assembly protein FliH|uniref:flagellar assembly protein FliH n=1 Tax=Brevibacillus TaxID=55080 RepID=UPI0014906C36|nr:flagellar assembly protein FliH [Brevibacillus borstelensis]MCC0563445.1 flagellar assembly protein FliH [Brevibacillus borstelensis]NOU57519.1 flagellar assembly protein FliH [Brevibacillus borstelensis]